MANTHSTLTSLFADIANAIREKTGGTEPIKADQFPEAISAIPAAKKTVSVTLSVDRSGTSYPVYYLDETGTKKSVTTATPTTVEALGGVVYFSGGMYIKYDFIAITDGVLVALKDGASFIGKTAGGSAD